MDDSKLAGDADGQESGQRAEDSRDAFEFARKIEPGPLALHTDFDRPVFWPAGPAFDRTRAATDGSVVAWRRSARSRRGRAVPAAVGRDQRRAARPTGVPRGGELLASVRSEPRSFNRHAARDTTTNLVSILTQAQAGPRQPRHPGGRAVARGELDDRRRRPPLHADAPAATSSFSDGHPFTADDVLFAFEAAYDEKGGSALADSLQAGGKKLQVTAPDAHTVVITFPGAVRARASGSSTTCRSCRGTSSEARSKRGTLRQGVGARHAAGRDRRARPVRPARSTCRGSGSSSRATRTTSRKAADGGALPYLDRLVVEIIPDQNAELLRLESGQLDMMTSEIAPEAYAPLKRAADEGRVKLLDLGVSRNADGLWFNLKPGALAQDPRAAVAAARRAAPGDLDGGRSQAVRRHRVPRRRACRSTARRRRPTSCGTGRACRRRRTIRPRRSSCSRRSG